MITRIAHLSDLHFPSRDEGVLKVLVDDVVRKRPDVVVVTGDLVNHGSWRASNWDEARIWLTNLAALIAESAGKAPKVLVLPGNHDVLFSGLFGFCAPAAWAFRNAFSAWTAESIVHDPAARLTFLLLDTNPRFAFGSAKGKAIDSRLDALKQALDRHPQEAAIRSSTKILLMHHHPLPVPFGGRDWLLETRRVDRLLQFVAENRIDLILHGHKHHATWSNLRIGATSDVQFFVEVVGAGSAFKAQGDHDPRGHNFNIIDIESNGVRRVRQFFKAGGAPRFSELLSARAEEQVNRMVLAHFRRPYRFQRFTWAVTTDAEGDAKNRMSYQGLVFNPGADAPLLVLPTDEVEIGQSSAYQLLHFAPSTAGASLVRTTEEGRDKTAVTFSVAPGAEQPAELLVQNHCLNAYVMDRTEAQERGLKLQDRGIMEFPLREIVEELCLELTFPAGFVFQNYRLEVLEPFEGANELHQEFTAKYSGVLRCETPHRLTAFLKCPAPNLRYRLSWDLPERLPGDSELGSGRVRRTQFEAFYLNLAGEGSTVESAAADVAREAIVAVFVHLWSTMEKQLGSLGLARFGHDAFAAFDVSMMVCDRTPAVPILRLVYWSGERSAPDVFKAFKLAIGEGNAGRAYRAGTLRVYDREVAAKNPKMNTLRDVAGGPKFLVLLSIPLLDPISHLPLGVVNVGSSSPLQADILRGLRPAHLQELAEVVHQEPLTGLLKAANLST